MWRKNLVCINNPFLCVTIPGLCAVTVLSDIITTQYFRLCTRLRTSVTLNFPYTMKIKRPYWLTYVHSDVRSCILSILHVGFVFRCGSLQQWELLAEDEGLCNCRHYSQTQFPRTVGWTQWLEISHQLQ